MKSWYFELIVILFNLLKVLEVILEKINAFSVAIQDIEAFLHALKMKILSHWFLRRF